MMVPGAALSAERSAPRVLCQQTWLPVGDCPREAELWELSVRTLCSVMSSPVFVFVFL